MNSVRFTIPFPRLEPQDRDAVHGSSRLTLCQREDGEPARRYLRKRGIDHDTVAKFRLGYVPFSIRHSLSGRIVIPIYNNYSELLALSVRPIFDILICSNGQWFTALELREDGDSYVFYNEEDKLTSIKKYQVSEVLTPKPKYWNESYPKAEHLFGLNLSVYDIAKEEFAIVCEGQFDVMSLYSAGIRNVVGINGAALSPIHVMLLKRWTDKIVFLLDGDIAGQRATENAKQILDIWNWKKVNLVQYAVVALPKEDDPDDFLNRNGSYIMRKYIADAMLQGGLEYPKRWVA